MPAQATPWLQVSGQRFLRRRLENALLGRDLGALDRAHSTSLAIGGVLAVALLAGCAVLGLLNAPPDAGDARIVVGKQSGALYVRVGDAWHPVLNLASARLIAASAANPRQVRDSFLTRTKRGPLLGIPGAPALIAQPLALGEAVWTICDSGTEAVTTVLVGPAVAPSVHRLAAQDGILVAAGAGAPTYLLHRGRRAVVDLTDRAVVHALRLGGQSPRQVSQALLNALPETAPLVVPRIPGAGAPAGPWLPGFVVGSVLRVAHADGDEYYVVLGTGIQRIGRVAADLLRFHDSQGSVDAPTVAPDALRAAPIVSTLPVGDFPGRVPTPAVVDAVTCVTWTPTQTGPPDIALVTGRTPPLPPGQQPVALVQADGRGPAVDAAYLPPGRSAYVVARPLFGDLSDSARIATRYLVTDTGVRFAIHDDEAARDLGLPQTAVPAPWPVLAGLPCGPELSRQAASVARDTVPARP